MKEHIETILQPNPITPAFQFLRHITYYPSRYADLSEALADIANLDVVLFLHGGGEWGSLASQITRIRTNDLPKSLYDNSINETTHPILDRLIIYCPQLLSDTAQFNDTVSLKNRTRIKNALDTVFAGAPRYHVTGLSRGGQGGYNFVACYPTFFTTWGCLAGNDWQADDDLRLNFGHPTGYQPSSPIPNTAITAIRHWHGTTDGSSNTYLGAQQTIDRLIAQNYPNERTLVSLPGVVHASTWPIVYKTSDLYLPWLASKIPALIQTRSGLHFDEADIEEWIARTNPAHPNYQRSGTPYQGWPNIIGRAADFVANPTAQIYTGVSRSIIEPVQKGDLPDPNTKAKYAILASFVALVTDNAAYAATVKDFLLAQIAEPKTDFSNTVHWTNQVTGDGPFHYIAGWLTRLFISFDYIKHFLSVSDRATIEAWFYNAGAYFHTMLWSGYLNKFASEADRNNSIMVDDWGGAVDSSDPYIWSVDGLQIHTHRDAAFVKHNPIYYGQTWFHDRFGKLAMFVGTVGAYFNEQSWINNAKYFVKNTITLAMFPDGTHASGVRSTDPDQINEALFYYSASIYTICSNLAEVFRRKGDNELYTFETSDGWLSTTGGPKSLKLGWKTLCHFREESLPGIGAAFVQYTPANDEINKINGDSVTTWHGVHNCWSALANYYYGDEYINASYNMEVLGFPSTPMAGNTSYMMQEEVCPDVLFMWGDRYLIPGGPQPKTISKKMAMSA